MAYGLLERRLDNLIESVGRGEATLIDDGELEALAQEIPDVKVCNQCINYA